MPDAVRVLAGLAAVPFLLGAAAVPGSTREVVFSFQDPRITESSGLVALGTGLFVTTNDSGDSGRVFTVDATGRTVGVTSWSDDARDVEALAPSEPGEVWVGDIGDNRAWRGSIRVTRVPVGRGERSSDGPVYDLTYPDGKHDAETLLAGPDGRLYVVTKGILGGCVYAAPRTLSADHDNRLIRVADGILPMATDGAVLPDGHHVLIRGYAGAVLYSFPDFDRIAAVPLPRQPQGEGLAVAADGTVYLSSEGRGSQVLRLPPVHVAAAEATHATASPSAAPEEVAAAHERAREASRETSHRWWPWLVGGGVAALLVWVQRRVLRSR